MSVLVIAANNLRRMIRERENLFFVFALPLLLIIVLGLTTAGFEPLIGIHVDGPRTAAVDRLIDGIDGIDGTGTVVFDDLGEATDQLEREDVTALVMVPADYERTVAAGGEIELEYRSIPTSGGFEVQGFVQSVVSEENAAIRATRLVAGEADLAEEEAATLVAASREAIPRVEVTTVDTDAEPFVDTNPLGFVAAQELVLFVFLMAMVAAAALIEVRRLGVTRRMLATPATTLEVVLGEALGRYGIALVQSGFIVGATVVLFGLDWGSWPATLAIIACFSLVATAVALLIGALVHNENQSTAVGISLGMALAALGGCMVPLEVFPDGLRTVAHLTPHAWAVDAFTEVIQRGGGLADIGRELLVLLAYGSLLLTAGAASLRRSIVG